MTFDDAFRQFLGEVRRVFREELAAHERRERPDQFMSVARAATYADVTTKTVRRWISAGKLREHRAGRKLLVRRRDLDALLVGGARDHELSPEAEADRDFR